MGENYKIRGKFLGDVKNDLANATRIEILVYKIIEHGTLNAT